MIVKDHFPRGMCSAKSVCLAHCILSHLTLSRDAAAAHEAAQAAQIQTQYQNMGLPPSLVQAARNHQQLTVVQAQPTPPQTPVSTITWKSAAVAPAAAAVIVPEPQKVTTDPRAVVNNVIRTNERQYSQVNATTVQPVRQNRYRRLMLA